MEFHKPKFKKKTYGGSRSDRRSGYNRDSRGGGSRFNRRPSYGRNDIGSRFSRGPENNRRIETTTVTCSDCGNETQIPFKPKYDRPVYCRECFQDHKPQSRGGSRFNRRPSYGRNDIGSRFSRGSRDNRTNEMFTATCGDCGDECQIPFKPRDNRPVYCNECFQDHKQEESSDSRFNKNSRYDKGSTKFQRDRTPIHRRESFRKTKFMSNDDESYQKNSRYANHNTSNSFYSTLRKKLFSVMGERKCVNCGFEDERALGFEQTEDAGSFDYVQRAGAASSWEKYVLDPDLAKKELQIICLNCNMIKQKQLAK